MARDLLRRWGSPSIDLFATSFNSKLSLYCSLVPDPQAVFEDVFRHPWDNLDLYAFPPFPVVGRVVARVRETPNLSMTLVAPLWPEKEWFADLLLLLNPTTSGASIVGPVVAAAPLQLVPQQRPCAEPSRMVDSPAFPPKVGLFTRFCCRDVRLRPHLHFPVVPGEVIALLWLVSWKEHCSSQRHCTLDRGLPRPLAS